MLLKSLMYVRTCFEALYDIVQYMPQKGYTAVMSVTTSVVSAESTCSLFECLSLLCVDQVYSLADLLELEDVGYPVPG